MSSAENAVRLVGYRVGGERCCAMPVSHEQRDVARASHYAHVRSETIGEVRNTRMHQTIENVLAVVSSGNEAKISPLLAEQVRFLPPTYYKTWTGREPVAALLAHVGQVFSDFRYRRVMGDGRDWALEFECKVGDLDAVGVDLITLDDAGLIVQFEVVMRPYKSIGALREAMGQRVMSDARFLRFIDALS